MGLFHNTYMVESLYDMTSAVLAYIDWVISYTSVITHLKLSSTQPFMYGIFERSSVVGCFESPKTDFISEYSLCWVSGRLASSKSRKQAWLEVCKG